MWILGKKTTNPFNFLNYFYMTWDTWCTLRACLFGWYIMADSPIKCLLGKVTKSPHWEGRAVWNFVDIKKQICCREEEEVSRYCWGMETKKRLERRVGSMVCGNASVCSESWRQCCPLPRSPKILFRFLEIYGSREIRTLPVPVELGWALTNFLASLLPVSGYSMSPDKFHSNRILRRKPVRELPRKDLSFSSWDRREVFRNALDLELLKS